LIGNDLYHLKRLVVPGCRARVVRPLAQAHRSSSRFAVNPEVYAGRSATPYPVALHIQGLLRVNSSHYRSAILAAGSPQLADIKFAPRDRATRERSRA
jgi:hypothetical protein